ncbi:MAG TPA: hypothetical protein VIK91_03105 [Nannocystis sp.]
MHVTTRLRRVLSLLPALALVVPPVVQAAPLGSGSPRGLLAPAPADDLAAFEAGFNEGQAKFDRGEYLAAARAWIAAAANLRETTANRDNRIAVYEYVVDAFMRGLAGEKRPEPLREAVAALDAYCEGFTRAYGTETPLSPKIAGARDEFKQRLEAAEAAAAEGAGSGEGARPEGPDEGEAPSPPTPQTPGETPWKGLAIGGGVLIGLGVGAVAMAAVGAARGRSLTREFDAECSLKDPSEPCQALLDRGHAADKLAIAGAVLAPVFLGAGVGLLAVGLKRRARAKTALAPALQPGYVGFSLRGRF